MLEYEILTGYPAELGKKMSKEAEAGWTTLGGLTPYGNGALAILVCRPRELPKSEAEIVCESEGVCLKCGTPIGGGYSDCVTCGHIHGT